MLQTGTRDVEDESVDRFNDLGIILWTPDPGRVRVRVRVRVCERGCKRAGLIFTGGWASVTRRPGQELTLSRPVLGSRW